MSIGSVLLVVLDGWGAGPTWGGNAITQARTPFVSALNRLPHANLIASGSAVGLPGNERGNSEVGHLTLGAGRIVPQDSTRINASITDGSFFTNEALCEETRAAIARDGTIHLMGLLTQTAIHASFDHVLALLRLVTGLGATKIQLHLFTDGRDAPPRDALKLIDQLEQELARLKVGEITTIVGRYYAMDRDHHWERTRRAYALVAQGVGRRASSPKAAVAQAYALGQSDEFIEPVVIAPPDHDYRGFQHNDLVIFWNFRADRARQLLQVCLGDEPNKSEQTTVEPHSQAHPRFMSLIPYSSAGVLAQIRTGFPPRRLTTTLADEIARAGSQQFHIAESEKYPHITYFFNGNKEEPLPGEERVLVPSPNVATYDLAPEMSAVAITDHLIQAIRSKKYRLLLANYANADMVGHTGSFQAAVQAVESIDHELSRLAQVCGDQQVALLITADHGNIEQMVNPTTGEPATDHTTNPVPCYFVLPSRVSLRRETGVLADVAPTILWLLGLTRPADMTGEQLLE